MKQETTAKANVKVDKQAGEDTTLKGAAGNVNDGVKGNGIEEVGVDHNKVMENATDMRVQHEKDIAHDEHLNQVDKKIQDLDTKKKIVDSAELKQLKEDSEVVKAMNSLPADDRTGEFSTVIGFYYKRMNENIKSLHEKLAKQVE